MPSPVTADWVGQCRVPTASEGPERIGGKASGKAQDALSPGRVDGETRGALPLLATPGVCPSSPDAKDPVSRFLLTGRHWATSKWLALLRQRNLAAVLPNHLTTAWHGVRHRQVTHGRVFPDRPPAPGGLAVVKPVQAPSGCR